MTIQPDGNGGWYVGNVDHLGASIHLTVEWLDEYENHQGKQHVLRYLLQTGSDDAEKVRQALGQALQNRRPSPRAGKPKDPGFQEFIKQQRGKRADRQ